MDNQCQCKENTANDQPKVYVASALANWKRARSIGDELKKQGITITYDWTQWGEAIEKEDTPGGLDPHKLRSIARDETHGVNAANVVLAIMPGERGSHFEMGLAWQTGTPIVLLTDGETAERRTSFHFLPRVEQIDDEQKAIDRTVEIANAFHLVESFQTPLLGW